jgi:hypothetical protein
MTTRLILDHPRHGQYSATNDQVASVERRHPSGVNSLRKEIWERDGDTWGKATELSRIECLIVLGEWEV